MIKTNVRVSDLTPFLASQNHANQSVRFRQGKLNGLPIDWNLRLWKTDTPNINAIVVVEGPRSDVIQNMKFGLSIKVDAAGTRVERVETDPNSLNGQCCLMLQTNDLIGIAARNDGHLDFSFETSLYPSKMRMVATQGPVADVQGRNFGNKALCDFATLLESGTGSDLTILVRRNNVDTSCFRKKVHLNIIKARAPRFEEYMTSRILTEQDGEQTVLLPQLKSGGLEIFLLYIYTGMIHEDWVFFANELVKVAIDFDLLELKTFFQQHFGQVCNRENAGDLYRIAERFGLQEAKADIIDFVAHDPNLTATVILNQ